MTDAHPDHPVLELDGVEQRFGAVSALAGIDLTIRSGEIVALLGPNGAGKSTAIDIALGLARPSGGAARLFGGPPRDAVSAGRVGAMLQGAALLPSTTVRESVALLAAVHRHPLPVDEALERAGAADIAGRRVSKLSGGERQRARFAVALVSDPELVVLDEPTAAMDVAARHGFWAAMQEWSQAGRTVLFATHYLEEADAFADRIVIVRGGRVVADGAPRDIKAVAALRAVSCTPGTGIGDGALAALPGVRSLERRGERVRLHSADSDATLRALLAADPGAHGIEVDSPSIDDAFLALTADDGATLPSTDHSTDTVLDPETGLSRNGSLR